MTRLRASIGRAVLIAAVAAPAWSASIARSAEDVAPSPAAPVEQRLDAASGAVEVTRTVRAPRGAVVGAALELEVAARVPAGARASFAPLGEAFGSFEVSGARVTPPSANMPSALRAELRTWDAGTAELPAMQVVVTMPDGGTIPVDIPPTTLDVGSLLPEDTTLAELAHGLRPAELPPDRRWLWWAGAGALAIGGLWVVWRWMRTRAAVPPPPVPPHEAALEAMRALEAQGLAERGEAEPFFVRLSAIVRTYVEARFGIAAPERTTQEFLREAVRHPEFRPEDAQAIGGFLRSADMVKFAADRPAATHCLAALGQMRGFVERTAPHAEEAAP